jgi:hypothetical protein
MYPEYDPNEPSLGQSWANMLRGFQNPQAYQEAGKSLQNALQLTPNVTESLGRGGVAQAIGTTGDLRDLRNTVQSYLPKSVQNWSNAAEFLTNPYAKALIQTAPTTEQTLEAVPRMTAPYEGYKQHETMGEYIAPSLGYFGGKALKAGKGLPVGLSIEDVTPPPAKVAEALRQPEKNALGFYSPLDEAVMNLQNQKGTGQQYLAQLLKTQGVKQEEVATRGLDQFLTENPKVTREQIAQHLRDNPVNLEEKVIGGGTQRDLNTMRYDDYYLDEGRPIDDPDYVSMRADDIYQETYKNDLDLQQEIRDDIIGNNPEKYADWETNDSINERLMRDVDSELYAMAEDRAKIEYDENPFMEHTDDLGYRVTGSDDLGFQVFDPQGNPINYRRNGEFNLGEAEEAIREDALNRGLLHLEEDEYGTKYHDYTLPNGENYREVLIQYPNEYKQKPFPKQAELDAVNEKLGQLKEAGNREEYGQLIGKRTELNNEKTKFDKNEEYLANSQKEYQSGHFDEPNILAHFRTTDRTIDGKKTLFVEEIQSDWHQAGRKKGYASEAAPLKKEYDSKLEDWRNYLKEEGQKIGANSEYFDKVSEETLDRFATQDLYSKLDQAGIDRMNELFNAKNQAWQNYKAKLNTNVPDAPFKKNWQELAMKRAMQMAAEGGYDRVAFTTGKQQANRYSLSKQIDSVDLIPSKEGDKPFVLQAWKDGRNVIRKAVTEDDLPDLIGKEAAKKLMEQEPTSLHRPEGVAHGNPNVFTGRELKGLDLDVGGEGMKGFYDKILPDFINKYGKKHGLKVGQTKLSPNTDINGQTLNTLGVSRNEWENLSKAEKEQMLSETGMGGSEGVHYFDLTPEAKESFLKKGQPMFAAAPAIGITDEDTRREVLEKLFKNSGN